MRLRREIERLMYKLVMKCVRNLETGETSYKWYAQIVSRGRLTRNKMGERIAAKTTVNWVDVNAVLDAMGDEIWDGLRAGEIVEVPPLGNFRLIITNKGGAVSRDAWKSELIKGVKVNFQETGGMRGVTRDLSYIHWSGDSNEKLTMLANAIRREEIKLQETKGEITITRRLIEKSQQSIAEGTAKSFTCAQLEELKAHLITLEVQQEDTRTSLKEKQTELAELSRLYEKYISRGEEEDLLGYRHTEAES